MRQDIDINKLIDATYPRLQAYTWTILRDKSKTHLDANDLIQTAFILLWEKGLEFNFENMRKPIYDAMIQYTYNRIPSITAALMNEQEKCCKKCMKIMPIDFFYKKKIHLNGLIEYQNKCKTCYYEIQEAKRQEKLADPFFRALHNEKKRIYQSTRSAISKSNERLHAYFKEQKRKPNPIISNWKNQLRDNKGKFIPVISNNN
jgi:hypothetical protein